jgi:hypothetical protein
MQTSLSLHFIDVQCLDMFRALLAHHQEALYGRRFGGHCVLLWVWNLPYPETSPHVTAHNSHQFCIRVVPPENEQVMPETCRDTEHQ